MVRSFSNPNISVGPDKISILFVSYLFPDSLEHVIGDQEISPMQTQRFGLALLDSLRAGFGDKIEVLSVAPLLDYPHCKLLIAPKAKWKIDEIIPATMVSFINTVGLKHLTRFLATFAFVSIWTFRNRKNNRLIILHGMQSCKIWGVLLGQILVPSRIIPFLTDDLGLTLDWERSFYQKLRRFDIFLMKRGMKKCSGIIAMTSGLVDKLAPDRPRLIIPAIKNSLIPAIINISSGSSDKSLNIVYAGGLFEGYGVNLLLEAFTLANRPNWRLLIAGAGELEHNVSILAEINPNIQFMGFLDSKGMVDIYKQADVLINPRLTSIPSAKLAFPSKIVEYLSTGKPVISSNLPIFEENFKEHLILTKSDTAEELIRCIDEVFSWSEEKRKQWRNVNLKFVAEELSPAVQGIKIRDFINELV
jgi:glycosyltransferase involved in cell wall biosynthesis